MIKTAVSRYEGRLSPRRLFPLRKQVRLRRRWEWLSQAFVTAAVIGCALLAVAPCDAQLAPVKNSRKWFASVEDAGAEARNSRLPLCIVQTQAVRAELSGPEDRGHRALSAAMIPDPPIAAWLSERFVCLLVTQPRPGQERNLRPEQPRLAQPEKPRLAQPEQFPEVATYLTTPDLEVIHFIVGQTTADHFFKEAAWALRQDELAREEAAGDPVVQRHWLSKSHADELPPVVLTRWQTLGELYDRSTLADDPAPDRARKTLIRARDTRAGFLADQWASRFDGAGRQKALLAMLIDNELRPTLSHLVMSAHPYASFQSLQATVGTLGTSAEFFRKFDESASDDR